MTNEYDESYEDRGTGAKLDLAVWRPRLLPGECRIVYTANNTYDKFPDEYVTVVKELSAAGNPPALAPPKYFKCVYNDKGTGGDKDGLFFEPVPSDDYVALSHVAVYSKDEISPGDVIPASDPRVDPHFRCVHKDLVDIAELGNQMVWDDKGSGGKYDGSVWTIDASLAIITSGPNGYSRPPNAQHKLSIVTQPILLGLPVVSAVTNKSDEEGASTQYTLTSSHSIESEKTHTTTKEIMHELSNKVLVGGAEYGCSDSVTAMLGTRSANEYMEGKIIDYTEKQTFQVSMTNPANTRTELRQLQQTINGRCGGITENTIRFVITQHPLL